MNNSGEQKKSINSNAGTMAVGGPGDILVTLESASSGSFNWAGGHAALVNSTSTNIESFGNRGDDNGVRYWPNDWDTRYNEMKAMGVSGATANNHSTAVDYGQAQIGDPYNINFFNINKESAFYCSQLVYKAWEDAGFNLNDGGAVWPVDLLEDGDTYVYYSQG